MNILHIFREQPDDLARSVMPPAQPTDRITEVCLDNGSMDYDYLLDLILKNDKIYTWF